MPVAAKCRCTEFSGDFHVVRVWGTHFGPASSTSYFCIGVVTAKLSLGLADHGALCWMGFRFPGDATNLAAMSHFSPKNERLPVFAIWFLKHAMPRVKLMEPQIGEMRRGSQTASGPESIRSASFFNVFSANGISRLSTFFSPSK